jgi:hypothetical protein
MELDLSTIDLSTPETRHQTLLDAAANHRLDANRIEAEAAEHRARAAGMDDKPGLADSAAGLRAEAVRLDEDANARRGAARAFEERAGEELAAKDGTPSS